MAKTLLTLLTIIIGSLLLTYCTSDEAEPAGENEDSKVCDTLKPSFEQEVKPIFTNNCAQAGCHGNGSSRQGYSLEDHSGIKDGVANGKVLCSIKHESGCSNMPQGGGQLSQEKIQLVECWAENGAPKN